MRCLLLIVVCLCLASTLVPRHAFAQADGEGDEPPPEQAAPEIEIEENESAEAILQRSEEALGDIQLDVAGKLALAALSRGGLDPKSTARAYELAGVGAVFTGNSDQARRYFEHVLSIDIDYVFDTSLGPQFSDVFNQVKGRMSVFSRKFSLRVVEVAAEEGQAPQVRIELDDPVKVAARLRVRRAGRDATWIDAKGDSVATFEDLGLTREQIESLRVLSAEAQALDSEGNVLAQVAMPPVANPAFVEPTGSVFESPVFWVITGLVVAGGSVGAVLAVTAETQYDGRITTQFGGI